MTLIVGIKCSDGVVIGADGAATLGNFAQHTVRQPVKKLSIIDNVILGVSGPVTLGQAYEKEVDRLSKASKFKSPTILTELRDSFWKHAEREWKAATTVSGTMGPAVINSVASNSVLAMVDTEEACLFQFNHLCSPEETTRDLPFVSIGSGQSLADPFLAFLKKLFWPKRLPLLADGIFATVWSLKQAIDTNTGGVADPIQVMTLSKNRSAKWVAVELTDEALEEHYQNISGAEQALANYKSAQVSGPAPAPPEPLVSLR